MVTRDQATTSGGKTQVEVNALLEKKKKEWRKEWNTKSRKKAQKEKEKKGKGPCFACQGPHRLNECPKWKKLMEGASTMGQGTSSGSGNV